MNSERFAQLVEETRKRNPVWFELESDPPAETDLIEAAESHMGVQFPAEYRFFLRNYGGGYFGFSNVFSVQPGSEWNVETRNSRLEAGVVDFLAISDPGTGDYYGFRLADGASTPNVYVFDHDGRTLERTLFSDLFDYLAAVALRP